MIIIRRWFLDETSFTNDIRNGNINSINNTESKNLGVEQEDNEKSKHFRDYSYKINNKNKEDVITEYLSKSQTCAIKTNKSPKKNIIIKKSFKDGLTNLTTFQNKANVKKLTQNLGLIIPSNKKSSISTASGLKLKEKPSTSIG